MDPINGLKERACAAVDAQRQALTDLSNRIHGCPELKFQERRAAGWLVEYLDGLGFTVEREAYGLPTAFAARLGNGQPRIAVLCEYDALPGIGHACGHNIIAAAGAGAGAALVGLIGETGGSLVVLGTPAEEGGGGKILMARAGAFDGVDAAMMVHPAGMDLAGMHVLASAFPHSGINALDGLVTAYNAIAHLRQHIRPTERIHGIITEGGLAPNIVPDRAAGIFMVRAATERRLAQLKTRVEACFQAGAHASGAHLTIRTTGEDYSDMDTNQPLSAAYAANLERLGRKLADITTVPAAVAGSTDMGNISKLVPSIHPMIAVSPPTVALHSAEFAQWAGSEDGHRAVVDGAKALAMTALDVLQEPQLLAAVRAAFAAQQRRMG
jgi:metal-dependent amidase/aminoacylase/carboxypeptidase family protein